VDLFNLRAGTIVTKKITKQGNFVIPADMAQLNMPVPTGSKVVIENGKVLVDGEVVFHIYL